MALLSKTQKTFAVIVLVVATILFLIVLRPFAFPIFWAAIFGLVLHPYYRSIKRKIRNGTLSALVVLVSVLIVVLIPLALIGFDIVRESISFMQMVSPDSLLSQAAPYLSWLKDFGVDPSQAVMGFATGTQQFGAFIISKTFAVSIRVVKILLQTLLMLYLLFFFLRDGEKIVSYLGTRLPLGYSRERFFSRFTSITRATIKGTLVIAVMQGIVGGGLLAIAGASHALLWGVAMAVLSVIPILGTFIIWLPFGIWFLLQGSFWQGVLVLFGSAIAMGIIENIIRPLLIERDTRMPNALVLVAILGGIVAFGVAGIVIGPVVTALAITAWDLFAETYNHLPEKEDAVL